MPENPPSWDVGTGAGALSYLLRFDDAAGVWNPSRVRARLTINKVPLKINPKTVNVVPVKPVAGLAIGKPTVAPDQKSVEIPVQQAPGAEPKPGVYAFKLTLQPEPFDLGGVMTAAAGVPLPARGATAVPGQSAQITREFRVQVEDPSRLRLDPGDVLLDSSLRTCVSVRALAETRKAGQWVAASKAPQVAFRKSSDDAPFEIIGPPKVAKGASTVQLRATRSFIGDGSPMDAGELRAACGPGSAAPPFRDAQVKVQCTTRPVLCNLEVRRSSNSQPLAVKQVSVKGDILRVNLTTEDKNLEWRGMRLKVVALSAPSGLKIEPHEVEVQGPGAVEIPLLGKTDAWSRVDEVQFSLKDIAPALWQMSLGKFGWEPAVEIDLKKMIAFDTLREIQEKGGEIRVQASGVLENPLRKYDPMPLCHFQGSLRVGGTDPAVPGKYDVSANELVFGIDPPDKTRARSGIRAAVRWERMQVAQPTRSHIVKTVELALEIGPSLRDPLERYLAHCLVYLAQTDDEKLRKDSRFFLRMLRVEQFFAATRNLARRACDAVDVRGLIMERMANNLVDFSIEVASMGVSMGVDRLGGGSKVAIREAGQAGIKKQVDKKLRDLGAKLEGQIKAADAAAEDLMKQAHQHLKRPVGRWLDDLQRMQAEIGKLEKKLGGRAAKKPEKVMALTARITEIKRHHESLLRTASTELSEAMRLSRESAQQTELLRYAREQHQRVQSALEAGSDAAAFEKPFAELVEAQNKRFSEAGKPSEALMNDAAKNYRQIMDAPDEEALYGVLRGIAESATDAELRDAAGEAAASIDRLLKAGAPWVFGGVLLADVGGEPLLSNLIISWAQEARKDRAAYVERMAKSQPDEPLQLPSSIERALQSLTPVESPLYQPPTTIASDTGRVSGNDSWLVGYVIRVASYYLGELAYYTTEGLAKVSEAAESMLGLDRWATNLGSGLWDDGVAHMHRLGYERGSLTFGRDTAQQVSGLMNRVRLPALAEGDNAPSLKDEQKAVYTRDAQEHKRTIIEYALHLASDALDSRHFAEEEVEGDEKQRLYAELQKAAAIISSRIAGYKKLEGLQNKSYLDQLRAVARHCGMKDRNWGDFDNRVDWIAWFFATLLRVLSGIGLFVPGGQFAALAGFAAADVVDIVATSLRLSASALGGLRNANSFIQDLAIINALLHAVCVAPPGCITSEHGGVLTTKQQER